MDVFWFALAVGCGIALPLIGLITFIIWVTEGKPPWR